MILMTPIPVHRQRTTQQIRLIRRRIIQIIDGNIPSETDGINGGNIPDSSDSNTGDNTGGNTGDTSGDNKGDSSGDNTGGSTGDTTGGSTTNDGNTTGTDANQ